MPVYAFLILSMFFIKNLSQHTKRSATYLIINSDKNLSLYKFSKQKNSINELLRFLKKMAASKPTLGLS